MTPPASNDTQQARTGVLVAMGLLLLVFGFAAMLALSQSVLHSNPVWFIGLLVIFAGSLALIAVVFRWLGLQAPGEAFGLPSGSVRTLLAVGVMVLFAVFGLAAISSDEGAQRPANEPMLTTGVVSGDAAVVQAEIKRYKALNIAAVPASSSASGAELKLYRMESFKSQEASDLQKQIITALVTLVTSVVSFYFGSRSVEAAHDTLNNKGKDSDRDAAPLPEAVAGELLMLDAMLDDLRKRQAALQAETATEGNEAALATRLSQAGSDLAAAEASRTQLDAAVKDLAGGTTTVEAVSTAVDQLKAMLAALTDLTAQAEALAAKG